MIRESFVFESQQLRKNGQRKWYLKVSIDDGKFWSKSFRYSQAAPAFSGYSDLAMMRDSEGVAVLYESGKHNKKGFRYDGIALKIVKNEDIFSHDNN